MMTLMRAASYFGEPWSDVEDDFIILNNGYVIGRITLYPELEGKCWFWTITDRWRNALQSFGYSADRDEALEEFRAQWLG
jgi:hypothetical protein